MPQISPVKLKITSEDRAAHFAYVINLDCSIACWWKSLWARGGHIFIPLCSDFKYYSFFLETELWSSAEISQARVSREREHWQPWALRTCWLATTQQASESWIIPETLPVVSSSAVNALRVRIIRLPFSCDVPRENQVIRGPSNGHTTLPVSAVCTICHGHDIVITPWL